jgi:hypothetical protein
VTEKDERSDGRGLEMSCGHYFIGWVDWSDYAICISLRNVVGSIKYCHDELESVEPRCLYSSISP